MAETKKFAKEKEEKEKAKAIEDGKAAAAIDNTENQTYSVDLTKVMDKTKVHDSSTVEQRT